MTFPTIPTGGRVVVGTQTGTSATRTFPSLTGLTKNSGDLLVAIIVGYQSSLTSAIFSSWGAGFTEIRDIGVSTQHCVGVAYKYSDGTETGTFSVTQAGTVTGDSAFILLSIPGAHPSTIPEVSAALATGTASAADPASLDPAGWAAEDTLWIAVGGNGETSTSGTFTGMASAPTNYGSYAETAISQDAVGGVQAAVAFRQLNASSENVGTFSVDVSNARNCAFVIAVRPAPDATTVNGSFTADAIVRKTQVFESSIVADEKGLFPTSPTNSDFWSNEPVMSKDGQVIAGIAQGQTKVYIARYPFTTWIALTAPAAGPSCLVLSDDGSVIVMGHTTYQNGAVVQNGRAFVYSGTDWGTQTILAPVLVTAQLFGGNAAISHDNSTIVIGASSNTNFGKIYVFTGASWGTMQTITPANGGGIAQVFISTDKTIIAAGDGSYNGAGSVRGRILIYNGSSYGTETQKTQSSPVNGDRMGTTTIATPDLSVIAGGYGFATNGGTNRGKGWAFSGSSWATETVIQPSDPTDSAQFWNQAAISDDGSTIVVGAYQHANGGTLRGKAYVFNGTTWGTQTAISSVSPVNSAAFGSQVKTNADGSVVWIAANADGTNNAGSISVCSGSGFSTVTRRMPASVSASDGFASSSNFSRPQMAISENATADNYYVLVAARNRANGGTNRGELHWFSNVSVPSLTLDAVIAESAGVQASFTANAVVKKIQSGSVTFDALIFNVWDWVSPPANGAVMSATPTLTLISPNPGFYPEWFQIQLDTSSSFNTGNLRTYRMGDGQGTWEYFNGSTWVAMPATGLDTSFKGNQVRFTVPVALSNGTWYRRWRWQVHT